MTRQARYWFDDEDKQIIQQRKMAKLKAMEEHNEENKRIFEQVTNKLKEYVEKTKRRYKRIVQNLRTKKCLQNTKRSKGHDTRRPNYLNKEEGLLVDEKKKKGGIFFQKSLTKLRKEKSRTNTN